MRALEKSTILKDFTELTEKHQSSVLLPELFTIKILRNHWQTEDVLMMGQFARP